MKKYKILSGGEIKEKLIISAYGASKLAIEKVKKAGGEIIIPVVKKMVTPLVEYNKKGAKKDKKEGVKENTSKDDEDKKEEAESEEKAEEPSQ